jgi:hypothetical protein
LERRTGIAHGEKRNWKEGQEKGFEKVGHREWRYGSEKRLVRRMG